MLLQVYLLISIDAAPAGRSIDVDTVINVRTAGIEHGKIYSQNSPFALSLPHTQCTSLMLLVIYINTHLPFEVYYIFEKKSMFTSLPIG